MVDAPPRQLTFAHLVFALWRRFGGAAFRLRQLSFLSTLSYGLTMSPIPDIKKGGNFLLMVCAGTEAESGQKKSNSGEYFDFLRSI